MGSPHEDSLPPSPNPSRCRPQPWCHACTSQIRSASAGCWASLFLPLVMASRLMGVEASLANGGVQAGLVENPGEDNHDMRVSLLGLPSLSVVEVPLFLLYSLPGGPLQHAEHFLPAGSVLVWVSSTACARAAKLQILFDFSQFLLRMEIVAKAPMVIASTV
ncbi:uncharacterized protein LOC120699738 isoform X3 [Panicum virgatum]|uniref:uncharacterized protein LOC120699738 isoform X3 n=1 Tax=Panicum virgatum TaxID=38727 RepID=UPI0019D51941|nr:uncharacterized protein LOC120699738 isoform X3 [Panicum virgatum]